MSNAEQVSLGNTLAGVNQYKIFAAVMGNMKTAVDATTTAIKSQGSAEAENAKQADSLKIKIQELQRQFVNLVTGEGGLANFIGMLVDTGTAILKFANSDIGQVIIKTTALIATLTLLNKGFNSLKIVENLTFLYRSLTQQSILLAGGMGTMVVGTQSLTTGLLSLAKVWAISPFGIATIAIGAIVGIVSVIDALTISTDEAREAVDKYSQEFKDLSSQIETTESNLEEVKSKIIEINSLNGIKITDENELNNLIEQRVELERQLAIQKLLREEARLKAEESAKQVISDKVTPDVDKFGPTGEQVYAVSPVENLKSITEELSRLKEEYRNLDSESNNFAETSTALKDRINELTVAGTKQLNELNNNAEALTSTDEATINLKDNINELVDSFIELTDSSYNASESTNSITDNNEVAMQATEDLAESVGMSVEEFEKQAEAMGLTTDQFADYISNSQELSDETDEINKSIDGLQNALSVAKKAQEEYNESGALTLDTFQSLLSLSPEYLSALINENGQVQLNEESLYNLTEQLKQAKIQELQNAMAADLAALANGNLSEMSSTAKNALYDLGSSAISAGNDAAEGAKGILAMASAIGKVVMAKQALAGSVAGAGIAALNTGVIDQKKAIEDSYAELIKSIDKIEIDFSSGGGSGGGKKGGSGGGKGKSAEQLAKDVTKAYKEQYDEQLALLKHELEMEIIEEKDYYAELNSLNEEYFGEASGHHEEFIDEYRKNQEAIYKWGKQQRKEALEDSKDKYEMALEHIRDTLDKQLDALKEERDEELEYLDKRIDKIEEKKDKELDSIKVTIDALKKEKKEFEKNIDSQIDSLEELKDKEEEEWDAKIEAFKEQNKLLEEQNELQRLQEALAKARSSKVKIFEGGKFTYGMDETAVSEAEQAIEDYYTQRKQEEELKALEDARDSALENYQKQIDDLKKYKDSMQEQYEKRIEDLELYYDQVEERYDLELEQMKEHREQIQEEYDEQIKDMEDYIDNVEDMVDSYEKEQNRLALIQIAGAEAENENWVNRLSNFKKFADEYKAIQKELDDLEKSPSDRVQEDVSGAIGSAGSGLGNILGRRSSGDSSIKSNGAYIVNENPKHKELVIGSSLNKDTGVLMNLNKGDGVVNTKSTNTLAGIFNSLGSSFTSGIKPMEKQSNSSNSLLIDKVYVQADNAMQFIDSMTREFKINMKQESFNPL